MEATLFTGWVYDFAKRTPVFAASTLFFTPRFPPAPFCGASTGKPRVDGVPGTKKSAQNLLFYGIRMVCKTPKQKEVLDVAHHNTILRQVLDLIPRHEFDAVVEEHTAGLRSTRKFSYWSQLTCLLFIHLSGRKSLRDGVRNLCANVKRLYHLGVASVTRSTFADANRNRPVEVFGGLLGKLYQRFCQVAPGHKFRFKAQLFSLDASTVKLNRNTYPWANFRKNKGGIKIHTLLDHNGYVPAFVSITDAKSHDLGLARTLDLPKGSIVVVDRAYICYGWFLKLERNGVFFVTRLKRNMVYTVTARRKVDKTKGLTSDQDIMIETAEGPFMLRRVGYRDPETGKHFKFLTNRFDLSAKTIADIYKDRWKIESFFRFIKQNLRIKSFVGRSENAVLIQVYVAMIACLLLALLKHQSKLGWGLQEMAQLLQVNPMRRVSAGELV